MIQQYGLQYHFLSTHLSALLPAHSTYLASEAILQDGKASTKNPTAALKNHLHKISMLTNNCSFRPDFPVVPWDISLGLIFIPINIPDTHWMLAVINVETFTVDFFDSLGSKASYREWKAHLSNWISTCTPLHFQQRIPSQGLYLSLFLFGVLMVLIGLTYRFVNIKHTHQTSGVDCGVFVLYYTLRLLQGWAIERIQKVLIAHY